MTETTAAERQFEADLAEARELAERHGTPEAVDVRASIYPDAAAADAWLESNRARGHHVLAKVPLPDGRVAGILGLRPLDPFEGREEA